MSVVVTQDGTHLHYDVVGKRDGTPVLMIQGLGVDSRGWALQRPRLGRTHRLVLFDNRGVGRSEVPPGPYDLMVMAEDAIACLDAAGFESAHVIGASMGGVIAQIIGVTYPERVRSLVLACTACRHHHWRRELLDEWANDVGAHGMRALVSSEGLNWLIGQRLHRRFGSLINILGPLVLQTKPQAFVAQVQAILGMSDTMRDELHLITAPTLVITGTQDSLTPVGDAEELHELIAPSRLVLLSGAAHGLMAEAPIAFNDAISAFLDEIDAADSAASPAPHAATL